LNQQLEMAMGQVAVEHQASQMMENFRALNVKSVLEIDAICCLT
jgi:hypothetical protein